jgi:hypothetical protein
MGYTVRSTFEQEDGRGAPVLATAMAVQCWTEQTAGYACPHPCFCCTGGRNIRHPSPPSPVLAPSALPLDQEQFLSRSGEAVSVASGAGAGIAIPCSALLCSALPFTVMLCPVLDSPVFHGRHLFLQRYPWPAFLSYAGSLRKSTRGTPLPVPRS